MPRRPHIHSAKFRRCVKKVSAKGGGYNPYAVCSASIPYQENILKSHKRSGRMPREAILKMLASPKTPKQLKAYWRKRLKKVI